MKLTLIQKDSGEQEPFSIDKFKTSLIKAGANHALIQEITALLKQQEGSLRSAQQIYGIAMNYLQDKNPIIATRYNVKRALTMLGPSGFPFEKFVAKIFECKGYTTHVDQIVSGACVEHEIDIIAENNKEKLLIECKFHHALGLKVDVTVTLAVKAIFDDIKTALESKKSDCNYTAWVVTNGKFTSQAIRYAQCVGINLLGWSFPADDNIQTLIDRFGLHPITALPGLSVEQKETLVKKGLVFCQEAQYNRALLQDSGLSAVTIDALIDQCTGICKA